MKSLKERYQNYKENKSLWGKITDVIFIMFIIAMLIPDSRLAIGGLVNRAKSMIIEPSVTTGKNEQFLMPKDYNWQLEDIQGNIVNLRDHQGKVIFLNLEKRVKTEPFLFSSISLKLANCVILLLNLSFK